MIRGGEASMTTPALIDTHLHLIYRDRLSYPWLAEVEPLNRDFPLAQYQTEARRCGITSVLHMEVDVAEGDIDAEVRHVKTLAAEPRSLLRGAISACRPESEGFPAFLERHAADPFVQGFRRVLHVVPDDLSRSTVFRQNLRLLAKAQKPFDICVRADQLETAIALSDACPDVQFVLDHCGVPAIKDRADHPWRDRIAEIAQRPNVAVKISGVVAYADGATWTLDDIRPYVEHAIESFGWNRVVWGSDWPVCTLTASLSTWVAATLAITRGCSVDERNQLLSLNARRVWRLDR
jgi:predicted TIM-barrel fold metal-dependent hydrolase